ncbi:methylated-DNA--protein-cysteine methyltransferase [Clostridium folliculivorans]|uniref:Methylated-DNA--protein-cysteine methyltransferase n=2 Tax=Clostridium folliculivorans TaxID=2886038 RepID=A0A9W5Y1A0_9CLOT|nr:methylated-DNA--protein-cysteine methyltransferase [Clostridium folliculivorans]GKU30735.1 methylated-DNA--protein-cysteine methyltransferase [Clostridium folliculivorans]
MMNSCYFNSKIGDLVIEDNGVAITKICFAKENREVIKEDVQSPLFKRAVAQLQDYFNGKIFSFDLPLAPKGTDFQKQVWKALSEIPYGKTKSYGDIAKIIKNEKAARAIGMANNKNPIMIIIPCHRVIGSNGSLVGYAGGIDVKRRLLDLESEYAKCKD